MWNHHQSPIGTTPIPEVNYSSKGKENVDDQNNHPKNFGKSKKDKRNKHKKSKFKEQSSGKGKKPFKCHCCGGPNHIANKYNIPQHLVDKEAGKAKWSFEVHFNAAFDEATTSGKIPDEAEKPSLMVKDYINEENMIIEYNLNDVFGDQD
jgi:hypothetical protein